MNLIMAALAMLVTCLALGSGRGEAGETVSAAPRSSLLLNGVWEQAVAPDGDLPAAGWQQVRVPHRSREFENDPPQSAWFRTQFTVPADWSAKSADIILDLSRVRHYSRVYLGRPGKDLRPVGEHWGMRTPFRIRLTDAAVPGGEYSLAIYTHNCFGRYAHPSGKMLSGSAVRALDTLFWYTGAATVGVEGDVWLRLEPRLRIEDIYVVPSLRTGQKKLAVDVTVRNDTDQPEAVRLDWRVTREGRVELDLPPATLHVGPRSSQVMHAISRWEAAVVWGRPPYGQPVLYFLQATLQREGPSGVADRQVARFGFREVWADGDKLLLNGQPLFPWGDHSVPYVHERQWLTRKLPDLAASGVSIIEHHRYDAPPVLYDVADEMGTFVVSSNFCVGSSQVPAGLSPDELKLVVERHLDVADTWIRRDRNHPSILFWDVTDTWAPEFCIPLMRKVKSLDKSRIVEVTYNDSPKEMVELIDTYRLFSGREQIEAAIAKIRADKALPVKPIRVGEAGIFAKGSWAYDEEPPMLPGWLDFVKSLPGRNIRGLQTFFITDMDYRGFTKEVPGMLSAPLLPKITWPSQSGADARIDPFGEGTQQAWGKAAIYLNWCDPSLPVSQPTATRAWWKKMHRELTGTDVGPLSDTRVPEVIVTVLSAPGRPVPGTMVFVQPLEGQGLVFYGVKADADGKSWFVLPEEGRYRFACAGRSAEVACKRQKVDVTPGYEHVQRVSIELFK